MTTSFPKSASPVVLLENVHPVAVRDFEADGYTVTAYKQALAGSELTKATKHAAVVGIRSKTTLHARELDAMPKLHAIGTYCIGVNQVDLETCTRRGIPVFNAPYSNTRSVVELVLGEVIMLMRNVFERSNLAHEGIWQKTATGSTEVRGKTLGIVGYGNIGSQLSIVAEALGMHVYYFDIRERLRLGNAQATKTLQELLKVADVVSLHVDGRKENANLIGKRELAHMKKGAYLINASRGHVVDLNALGAALRSGSLRGAALDVFPEEPESNSSPFTSPVHGLPNVILTPHVAGSTEEAQENIGEFTTKRILKYLNTGNSMMSVNFPALNLPPLTDVHRIIHIHKNVPGILRELNNIFADRGINVVGQYLKTNEDVGYVVTDVNKAPTRDILSRVQAIPNTIRARILY